MKSAPAAVLPTTDPATPSGAWPTGAAGTASVMPVRLVGLYRQGRPTCEACSFTPQLMVWESETDLACPQCGGPLDLI